MVQIYFIAAAMFVLLQSALCQVHMCHKKQHHRLNFTLHARKYGYTAREYDVLTQDSYYLKLFNIPGGRRPILLMHGLIDSADTFIIRGNTSLALTLANAGYDVWVGNVRGNRYGRRHEYLNPDRDDEFWDYSFHEMGMYDLPAVIDFVLKTTGEARLSAIGHSQGNTIFYVLGALRPEYNEKICILIALSPVCYLSSLESTISNLVRTYSLVNSFLILTGQEEILGDNSLARSTYEAVCGCEGGYNLCMKKIIFPLFGSDSDELESKFFPTVVEYYPSSTSRKNLEHTYQISMRRNFSQYDYGPINFNLYENSTPPDYDLSKVTMKTALIAGRNDKLTPMEDVKKLRDSLPNVVEYVYLKYERFNHIDAVWGRRMNKYLFPDIFTILKKYTD